MRHLQTLEFSKTEHKELLTKPYTLRIPPSDYPQEFTLTVAHGRRNGRVTTEPEVTTTTNGKRVCTTCGAKTNVHGKPFSKIGFDRHVRSHARADR